MSYTKITSKYYISSLLVGLVFAAFVSQACTTAGTNTSSTSNANAVVVANANTAPVSPTGSMIEAREPERYSVTTTITIQPTGNAPQANIPPLQFAFARMGTDRRVSFKLPDPVG